MVGSLLIFTAGLLLLYLGAEALVKAASQIALQYGVRPLVVGLTIVALGTSLPEFGVNVLAAATGEDDLALGNIIGSNISNVGLVLGASALVAPLAVRSKTVRQEYPLMMGAMVAFYATAKSGVITQAEGLLLVLGLVGVMAYLLLYARRPGAPSASQASPLLPNGEMTTWRAKAFSIAGGILGLGMGAHLMVGSAVTIAETLGASRITVGLTIVAVGTSLPELAASLVSAARQQAGLAVGNVLGSNLLNALFVVGAVALVKPLAVEASALRVHFPVMIALCALLLPVAWTGYRITRWEGALLLIAFLGYIAHLVASHGAA